MVKKKADPDCLAANSYDCLVWCLIEKGAVTESLYIVKDTLINKSFILSEVTSQELVEEGGFTE